MSDTIRIYNKPNHLLPQTNRSWICMGRCPLCRDPNKEPRAIRRKHKAQFRHELPDELDIENTGIPGK